MVVIPIEFHEIDLSNRAEVVDLIEQSLANHPDRPKRVVLDMATVDFIDSSGLGALIALLVQLQHEGSELVLRNTGGLVRRAIEILNLEHEFRFDPPSAA